MLTALPPNKITNYRSEVTKLMELQHTRLSNFKSVIGKLSFATCVIPAGRCFLRRMQDGTRHFSSGFASVTLNEGIREYLKVWVDFLTHFNGKTYYSPVRPLSFTNLNFFSDSSFSGFEAIFRSKIIRGTFPNHGNAWVYSS